MIDFNEWGEDPVDEAPRRASDERLRQLVENLTPDQRASVEHRGSPLVILAGAGTGKTTALTHRIGHIISSGDARPDEILAVTFTNKAARELETRIKRLLQDDLSGLTVGTFHAINARILRDNADKFDLNPEFTIIDSDDQKRMIKRIVKNLYGKGVDKEFPDQCLQLIEEARNNPEHKQEMLAECDPRIRTVYQDYQVRKDAENALDFTDLISRVVDWFGYGEVDFREIMGRWTHILVDEYQDTNGLQFRWLQYAAAGKKDVAVVGDDDQVLYSWRGAKIENMLDFSTHFPDAKIIRLEQNFRSTGYILDAANGLIAHNRKRLGKTLVTDDGKGRPVHVRYFVNAEMEARWIVDEIKLALEDGMKVKDIAVLSRASHALNLVEQKLTWAGIPYVLSGGKRFQDKAEIRDAMAYLRLAINPNDSSAFDRVVNVPKRGMGEVSIKKIIDAAEKAQKKKLNLTLIDIAENYSRSKSLPGDVPEKLAHFVAAVRSGNSMYWRGAKAGELIDHMLDASGYRQAMELALAEAKDNGDNATADGLTTRQDNLADLVQHGAEMLPHELIENLGLSEDGRSRKADGVWIGTIHAAKGLEWPMVIGLGWEDNLLPSWQALADKGEGLAEERRCAYVMITRARQHLTLTLTGERFSKPAFASRFLTDIPEESYSRFDMQPE